MINTKKDTFGIVITWLIASLIAGLVAMAVYRNESLIAAIITWPSATALFRCFL